MDSLTQLARRLEPLIARKAKDVARRVIMAAAGAGIFVDANTIHLSGAVILLRHPGAARLAEYPATTEGLAAALAAAVAGDTVLLPGGEISLPVAVISEGTDTEYKVYGPLGTAPLGWEQPDFDDSGWESAVEAFDPWAVIEGAVPIWASYHPVSSSETVLFRGSITLPTSPVYVKITLRCDDQIYLYVNGVLALSYTSSVGVDDVSLDQALFHAGENTIAFRGVNTKPSDALIKFRIDSGVPIIIPAGVEVVGLGKNTILDGDLVNNGILTNCTVTGTVTGTGKLRMVYNASGEQITDLVLPAHNHDALYAPIVHNHDTDYAPLIHDHIASDINSADATDGQVLTADGLGGATWETPAGGSVAASAVSVDASGFAGNLSAADTDVQTALETLDAMTAGGAGTLGDLTDVTISSPSSGQVLKYNGSAWVNGTDATGEGGTSSGTDVLMVQVFS